MSEPTGDRFRRLRLGLAARAGDGSDGAREAHLAAFTKAIGDKLGIVATGQTFAQYAELLEAMHDGQVDVAWLPPVVAMRAQARGRTIPIALPVRGGASTFYGALFAKPSFAPGEPSQLAGARVAWVDEQSAAGYIVVRAWLRASGVDPARAFSTEAFLGSHAAVVDAVLSGAADVGATYCYVDAKGGVTRAGWAAAPVKVIARAGPIPVDVLAAGIGVPVALIRAVQRALCTDEGDLVRAPARALFAADGFVEAKPEHLEPLSALLVHMSDGSKGKSSIPPPMALRDRQRPR